MPNFMLLLRESTTDFADMSPAEIEKVIAEYVAWSNATAEAGKLVGGQKLQDGTGRLLALEGGSLRVTDGPYAEAKEVIGGYFEIAAADYDEAVSIAESCPHLAYGGRIEIRQVEPTE